MSAPSNIQIGIDSQCLSYLIDALCGTTEPVDTLAIQKVALVRLFLYMPSTLWVTPTVTAECARIRNTDRAELHASFIRVLFGELSVNNPVIANARATEFGKHHAGISDCIIAAEAEQVGNSVLLSFDRTFISRLSPQTNLQLLEPAAYWNTLALPKGAIPNKTPHLTNPLSEETWWLW